MAELDVWSVRSMFRAVLRQIRWLGSWVVSLLGPDSPEAKALHAAYVAFEAGARNRKVDVGNLREWDK